MAELLALEGLVAGYGEAKVVAGVSLALPVLGQALPGRGHAHLAGRPHEERRLQFFLEALDPVQKGTLDDLLVSQSALESLNFIFKFLRPSLVLFLSLKSLPGLVLFRPLVLVQ